MRKVIVFFCFLFMAGNAQAMVTDWPHNETNNITCTDCHSYSLWWQFSPVDGDPLVRAEKTNSICSGCHTGEAGAQIFAEAHSSTGMGAFHDTAIDPWARACTDCHNPHFQEQLNWYGDPGVADDDLFVITGKVDTIIDNGDGSSSFHYTNLAAGPHIYWDDNVTDWTRKSGTTGRGLVMAVPVTPAESPIVHEIIGVDEAANVVTVNGVLDPADDNATFGLLYGQLIRDRIEGAGGPADVKFFDPYGGFVDSNNNEGVCQVCHTQTNHFRYDDNATLVASDHQDKMGSKGNSGKDSRCTSCHTHVRGFAPASDGGQHPLHLGMAGVDCNDCHTSGIPDPLTEVGCNICHNNGKAPDNTLTGVAGVDYLLDAAGNRYGLPNDMSYRNNWNNLDPAYSLNCNSCHNGRLKLEDAADTTNYSHLAADTQCDSCHTGNSPDLLKGCTYTTGDTCLQCHDGAGTNGTKNDYQESAVGMQTAGHTRLASSKWIRQYDCFYCHAETVTESYAFLPKHTNHTLNVDIENPQWATTGKPDPKYTYNDPVNHPLGVDNNGDPEQPNTCYNVYCHTDGTTVDPEMRPYPWTGGHQECNSCHGHAPGTNCTPCHTDGRSWDDYPDKKWLSAMPMYPNTGPRTDKANSHYRHLFTGFSCDDCHFDTIAGGSCLDCHATSIPTGSMNESKHINADFHVNRKKNIVFKNGGTYDPTNKSCDNTACHTGYAPEWGGSVYDSIVCRKCHGVTDADVDDFGKSNGIRAKINLNQWATTGHGRQGYVADNGTSDNPYPSGNPPANFPDNGCWYCHDSRVLHQNEERPFRLIQHEHFKQRFEKECVFCHMTEETGNSSECLVCHNDVESLAPQLNNLPSAHAQSGDMTVCTDCHKDQVGPPVTVDHVSCTTAKCHTVTPATWSTPDHRQYNADGYIGASGNTSCDSAGCHVDDASRHNTGAGAWTSEEKEDIKNSYVQMGVCLKCHDDDSSGECASCHVRPADDPATPEINEQAEYDKKYALGFDPADLDPQLAGKTAGVIVAKKSRASSFHFGYKHYQDFVDSNGTIIDSGVVDAVSSSTREILDQDKIGAWSDAAIVGRRVKVTSGVNSGLLRPIVRIDEKLINGVNYAILTVAPAFPDGQQLQVGDTYEIRDHVWKGGKFCWDCHDPHGDDNIYMVQNEVATRTDGVVGKPITRKAVSFIRKTTGTDYVDLQPDQDTGEYNGICNVCHTNTEMHYTSTKGDGHNSSRICTECHEHRFTNSHASGQPCNTCHRNRPVPRHTAFGQARDCTKCHKDAINGRMNIMAQFSANSHHVQGVKVTNKHCYACHWEATPEGVINVDHHGGYNYKTHESVKNDKVDLVVWQAGKRPLVYDDCATDGNVTAVTFLAKDIDIWSSGSNSTLEKQRAQVDNVTTHCLGCHSDQNNDTEPFNIVDPDHGDCKTPRQYAWDRASIKSRYGNKDTATFGKYSGPNVAEKKITKAFSAHGNAIAGGGGWDSDNGTDEAIGNTRNGLHNIQCFDCHSSHGSMVEGTTSSYTTFNGTKNGANLKETQAGKGGYTMTYKATANPDPNTINPYQAGAGQCFDCHDTPNSNTQVSVSSTTPWGYNETFQATAPIRGYRDSERFGEGVRGVNQRFPYRKTTLAGGHFKASHRNINSPNYDPSGSSDLSPMGTIDGLCTPCHDPHGVSPSLGANGQYALPILKGTWMTSPYKEDSPEMGGTLETDNNYRNYLGTFIGGSIPMQQQADGRPTGAWRTDRNTFNQADLSQRASYPTGYNRVAEEAQQFAGLCLRCHPKSSLTSDIDPGDNATKTENLAWKSRDRIHRSVKGWGWSEGDKPREHSYTCSKCHSAHVSGLPRLMRTNCLNFAHRGQMPSGSLPGKGSNYFGKFPYGFWTMGTFDNYATNTCHGADTANGSANWPDNQGWNNVTPWEGQ